MRRANLSGCKCHGCKINFIGVGRAYFCYGRCVGLNGYGRFFGDHTHVWGKTDIFRNHIFRYQTICENDGWIT